MVHAWTGPARCLVGAGEADFGAGGVWPWDWVNLSSSQAERMWERLGGLVAFLNRRYAWEQTVLVPPCWAFHGGLVEELTTLYWSRWAAFSGPAGDPDRAQNWHTYHLPAFYQRMALWCGGPHNLNQCQMGKHQPPRLTTDGRAATRWAELTAGLVELDCDIRPAEATGYANRADSRADSDPEASNEDGGCEDERVGEGWSAPNVAVRAGRDIASLEKLRADRESNARENLDSWADDLRSRAAWSAAATGDDRETTVREYVTGRLGFDSPYINELLLLTLTRH